eukprot:Rhum_TRINITY_DN15065_c9_g4::Rhum_TRINITY_DN15065_c9_g4_i2::g.137287::m.137287
MAPPVKPNTVVTPYSRSFFSMICPPLRPAYSRRLRAESKTTSWYFGTGDMGAFVGGASALLRLCVRRAEERDAAAAAAAEATGEVVEAGVAAAAEVPARRADWAALAFFAPAAAALHAARFMFFLSLFFFFFFFFFSYLSETAKQHQRSSIHRLPVREPVEPLGAGLQRGARPAQVVDLLLVRKLLLHRPVRAGGQVLARRVLRLALPVLVLVVVSLQQTRLLLVVEEVQHVVMTTDDPLPRLVVREDEQTERNGRQPVHEPQLLQTEDRRHTRHVHEERGERRLEEESEVQLVVLHALVEQRQTTRLADQDVRPLHNHDRAEEGSLRRAERLDVLRDGEATERRSGHGEVSGKLAVVRQLRRGVTLRVHDGEVREESGKRLHDTDLEVRERDQTEGHKVVVGRTRLPLHDVLLRVLVGERDGGDHVGTQVDAQNQHRRQGQGQTGHDERHERRDLRDVRRQRVRDRLLQVVEDQTALLHTTHDRREVVVHEDHVGSLLRHVSARDTHADTDTRLRQGRGVVHTVTRHGRHHLVPHKRRVGLTVSNLTERQLLVLRHVHHVLVGLTEVVHDEQLLDRRRTGEHQTAAALLQHVLERVVPVQGVLLRVPVRHLVSAHRARRDDAVALAARRLLARDLLRQLLLERLGEVRLHVRVLLQVVHLVLRQPVVLLRQLQTRPAHQATLRHKLLHRLAPQDADALRDGRTRPRVVARHHDNVDRRAVARAHGLRHSQTRRVLQREDAGEHQSVVAARGAVLVAQVLLEVRAVRPDEVRLARVAVLPVLRAGRQEQHVPPRALDVLALVQLLLRAHDLRRDVDVSEAEQTQTLRRHQREHLLERRLVVRLRPVHQVLRLVHGRHLVHELPHAVGASLHEAAHELAAVRVRHPARLEHPLVLRVERDRSSLHVAVLRPEAVDAVLALARRARLRELHDRLLRRVSRRRALLDRQVRELRDHLAGPAVQLVLHVPLRRRAQRRDLHKVRAHLVADVRRRRVRHLHHRVARERRRRHVLRLRRRVPVRALLLVALLRAVRRRPRVHHRHLVLRQRARLVGADHTRRPERLHSLQVLHQHHDVLHPLRRQRQRHRHRRQQTLRHVRHNDTDREHDGVHRDSLVQRDVDDQEHHSEHNRDRRDDLHEPVQLLPDRRVVLHLLRLEHHHVVPAHHRLVARRHSHAPRLAERDVRALHHNVLLAQRGQRRVLRHRRALLHLERLAGQRRLHDREPALRAQHTHVARDLVSQLDVQHVARHDQAGVHGRLRAVAHHARLALTHRLELLHHLSRRSLLLVREDRRDQHDREQHNAEEKVLLARASRRALNTVRNEAQHTSGNQKHREETRELQQELHNLRQVLRRGQRVLAVDVDHLVHLVRRQTLRVRRVLHVDVPGVALLQVEHLVVVLRAREVRARELAVHRELVQVTHLLRRLQVAHVALHPGLRLLLQLVARRAALPKDILLQLGRLLLRGCRLSRHSRPPASLFLSFR